MSITLPTMSPQLDTDVKPHTHHNFFFHSTQYVERKKLDSSGWNPCTNNPMLVQQSSLLSYFVLTGGRPLCQNTVVRWWSGGSRQTFFGQDPSTEAGRTAGFCRSGCHTHWPDADWFLLNKLMLADIQPMCIRLKSEKESPESTVVQTPHQQAFGQHSMRNVCQSTKEILPTTSCDLDQGCTGP